MEALKELFDTYGRQARLQPALFTLGPMILTVVVWVPSVYSLAATITSLAATFGVVAFFANWARARGRAAEQRIYIKWGGRPTTIWLRHSDSNLDEITKRRYHSFLETRIPEWHAPTGEEEKENGVGANARYDSAVKWLLEYTRNQQLFPLVFKELVAYGFRRNLYAMKAIGLLIVMLSIVTNIFLYSLFPSKISLVLVLFALGVALCFLISWIFIIRKKWVKDAADGYARALLSSCESRTINIPS